VGLSRLQEINLMNTKVTHVGIAKLTAALPNTRIAHNAAASAEEAKAIAHFESLGPGTFVRRHKMLMLYLKEISQQDLDAMSKIVDLKDLTLAEFDIEDAGLVAIAHQDKLLGLELFDTAITDAGLMHLKNLSALKTLTLRKTAITDAGLVHLEGLKKLESLDLRITKVTEAGVKRLQEVLPKCDIRFQD
jgi:Leucine-rich repeat (LRR) protein